jgi:2-polyprenyl-3-methyl-5-hydroxy-6-metoxy-1,4-benzoquinol methylase
MKASIKDWVRATENLNIRRKQRESNDDNARLSNAVRDYKSHITKCGFGNSVLDVGCGGQFLKQCLPEGVEYIGIDAFPIVENTVELAIEDDKVLDYSVDTVCAFAVLDNCRDFYKACENMRKIAKNNVIILTGIGIDPDQYHTFRLELEHFDKAFEGMDCTHKELISPKVYLLCYTQR